MKGFILLISVAASVYSVPQGPGWPASTTTPAWSQPTTTTGWTTQPPTTTGWTTQPPSTGWTTPGWSPPGGKAQSPGGWPAPTTQPPGWPSTPPPTQGWNPPPPSGWSAPNNVNINLDAALAAAGAGWAAENHQESVNVEGGWGVPAELSISAGGDSILDQQGQITQVTSIDSDSAASLNVAQVSQSADANEGMGLLASGLNVVAAQSGAAAIAAEGSSAEAAESQLIVNQG